MAEPGPARSSLDAVRRTTAAVCIALALLLAASVLVGYVLGLDALKRVAPGFASMKANTAVGLLLLGASAAIRWPADRHPTRARVGTLLAAVAVGLGVATLFQYLTGVSLGIDELLFRDTLAHVATSAPGRMSPLTAANLVLVGTALAVLDRPGLHRAAGWLGLPVLAICLFVFTNYLFGAAFLASYSQVAVHTAAAFVLLVGAMWSLRPDSGPSALFWSPSVAGGLARRLLPLMAVTPLAIGYARVLSARNQWIGLYEGIAAFALTMTFILLAVAWVVLRRLDDADAGRLRTEEHLRHTIGTIELAERATRRGSWEWDVTTDRATWSRGMYDLFGVDPATFVNSNDNFLALVHPDDRARMGQAIADALAKPGRFLQEYRLTRPDGRQIQLRGEGNVVLDPDGKPRRLYGVVADVTEVKALEDARAAAERAVQESEERLRSIFENSQVAITLARPDGSVIEVNPAAEAIWRRSRADFFAKGFDAGRLFVDAGDRARIGEALRSARNAKGLEARLRRDDGQVRVFSLGIALVSHQGQPAVLSTAIDVTDLRAAEERFRRLFEANPVAVVISRTDGAGFVDVNPAYCRLVGFDRAELLAPGFDLARLSARPERRAALLESLRASGGADALETDIRRKDGAIRTVVASVRTIEHDGTPCFLTSLQDVTEQRATEAAARKAQERFASVFRSSPVAIALTKEDGRFVDANDAYSELVGRPRSLLLDGRSRSTEVWEDPQDRQRMLNAIRDRGLVRDLEVRIRRPDGEVRTALASIEFIDLGGDTTILSLLQDITDRQRAQADREARIATEAELERLRRTDQFRTDFINSTAHELATPLTPLVLHVKTLAADAQLNEAQRRMVDALQRNVARLRHLVDDMVGAADLQARTLSLDRRRLNLTRELRAAVAAHHPAAERAGIALEEPQDNGLTVSADPARLQLVLGHLLGNAIKFTPTGGRVSVHGRRDGDVVRVEVTDTGVGLTSKQMEGLWKPFAQAHDKSQRTDSGSGLGLYVSKGIVELHGGEVGCRSAGPGKGSTFWFTLPLSIGHVDPLSRPRPEDSPAGPRRDLNPGVKDD